MVAVPGESPLDLQALLGTLESKSSSGELLLEAYTKLSGHLNEGELSLFERDIVEQGKRLVAVTKKHARGKGGVLDSVAQKALCVMGYCLNDKEIVSFLPEDESSELLTLLSEVITETKEKSTCSHALWCLGRQSIAADVITTKLPSLLSAINKAASNWWGASVIVEHEGLVALNRLSDHCRQAMEKHCAEWGALLLRLLVSAAPKVRNHAYDMAHKWAAAFAANKECMRAATVVLKEHIKPELEKMFKCNAEAHALKVCNLLLRIFKKELHHGTVINSLLSILELGFRTSTPETRAQTFRSWRTLIDCFADTNILTDAKILGLVIKPLTVRNTPTEAVAMEKLITWWHCVQCMGPRVWHYFDQILKPLLQFCVGSVRLGSSAPGSTPNTPGRSVFDCRSPATRAPGSSINLPNFPKIQQCGMEILAFLLKDPNKTPGPSLNFTLDPLKTDVTMSVGLFLKNANILISALFELTKILSTSMSESLLLYVWQCAAYHMRMALDTTRSERHEALSSFLGQFQVLVLSQILSQRLTMKLFQLVCSFPAKVLSSTAFSISSGHVAKGCPAQFLCEVLLTPTVLKDSDTQESFMTVFSTLVRCGTSHPTGVLEFCQRVGELLDCNTQFLSGAEVLWRLWSVLAHTLQEHISKTHEVNQGDSLEYNFDCMYTALLLPVSHRLDAKVAQTVHKTAMKTWSELYHTFARLSALVSNAEANIVLEEFSRKILNAVKAETFVKDAATLAYLLEVCQTIVDTIDFSSLTTANPFMQGITTSVSPAKKGKQRLRPLGHLHSFVTLLSSLAQWVMERIGFEAGGEAEKEKNEDSAHLCSACTSVVDTVSVLVSHLNVSSLICHMMEKLASPLAALFAAASAKKTPAKLNTPAFSQKLEKLWQEVCSMLQQRFKGPYDSELLQQLSPLLQATFQHSRRQIKSQTAILWNATFGQASTLTYPADLQPVVSKVKDKTQLSLPGWINVDIAVIDETPVSQMSQMDSQAPDPVLPGMPSPQRHRGSFLNKDLSPKPSAASPNKRAVNRSENIFGSSARKKLSVDAMSNKDFVVIKDTPNKRRILTEHQRETLKEKRVLPAMYNNLDASQDRSLMSHFASSDTQQDSLLVSTPPSDVIVISSSQSQDLLHPEPATTSQADADKFATPRRSSRRRSVRFEDSEQESRDSDSPVITAINPPGQTTASNKTSSVEMVEKLTSKSSSEEKSASSKSSSEEVSQKSGEGKRSFNLPPPPEQNVMAAVVEKLVDTLSSRDTSLSAKSLSSQSSGEEKQAKSIEENDPFFRPFKSLSQTLFSTRSTGGADHSDGSVLLLTRRTRSQESVVSKQTVPKNDTELTGKSGGDPPRSMFTGLEKWLKKASGDKAEGGKEKTEEPSKKTDLFQEITPPRSGVMLVEETQSPTSLIRESPLTNMSIQETPPKTSASSSPVERSVASASVSSLSAALKETVSSVKVGNKESDESNDAVSILPFKEPFVQLERLSEVDLLQQREDIQQPSSPMEEDTTASKENDVEVSVEPPVLGDEDMASQGFSLEQEHSTPPDLAPESEETVGQDVKTGEKSIPLDHQNLFGFAELLEDKPVANNLNNSQEEKALNESIEDDEEAVRESLPAEAQGYNPDLTATLRLTPPQKRTVPHSQTSEASSSSNSQKSSSSSTPGKDAQKSSQEMEPPESDVSFDPAKDSTLNENAERPSERRKQRTPKRIEDPQSLRRTPRKKKGKKSFCSCCKDGANTHHLSSPRNSGKRKRQSGKQDPQTEEKSPVRKRGRKSLSQGSVSSLADSPVPKRTRSLSQGGISSGTESPIRRAKSLSQRDVSNSAESPISKIKSLSNNAESPISRVKSLSQQSVGSSSPAKQSKISQEGPISNLQQGQELMDPSPQDMGEKTPDTKTNSTPLRLSTTKKKMEAAKRRSLSLSKEAADSDSDDIPLSKIGDVSKLKKTEGDQQSSESVDIVCAAVLKCSPSGREWKNKTSLGSKTLKKISPALTVSKRGVSRLQLKKLAKHRLKKAVRSPPKLRLRQRKAESPGTEKDGSESRPLKQLIEEKIVALELQAQRSIDKSSVGVDKLKGSQEVQFTEEIMTDPTQNSEEQAPKENNEKEKVTSKESSSKISEEQPAEGSQKKENENSSLSKAKSISRKVRPVSASASHTTFSHTRRLLNRRANTKPKKKTVMVKFERGRRLRPVTRSALATAKAEQVEEIEEYESNQLSVDIVSQSQTRLELKDPEVEQADPEPSSDAGSVLNDKQAEKGTCISDDSVADKNSEKDPEIVNSGSVASVSDTKAGDGEGIESVKPTETDMDVSAEGSEDMFADSCPQEAVEMSKSSHSGEEKENLELSSGDKQEAPVSEVAAVLQENSCPTDTSETEEKQDPACTCFSDDNLDPAEDSPSNEKKQPAGELSTGDKDIPLKVGGSQESTNKNDTETSDTDNVIKQIFLSDDTGNSESLGFQFQSAQQDECETMEEEEESSTFTEDSVERLFPHNQVGLEDLEEEEEEEELSSAGMVQDKLPFSGEDSPSEAAGKSLSNETETVLNRDPVRLNSVPDLSCQEAIEDQSADGLEEVSVAEKQHASMQTSPGMLELETQKRLTTQMELTTQEGLNHTAVQTSPQKQLSSERKFTKKEILEIIAASDVTPTEIIAALQTKTPNARRLFPTNTSSSSSSSSQAGKLQGHLPSRGFEMLQQSMRLQKKQHRLGGYPMAAGRNVGRVGASPIAVPIIISSPSASPTNSILKRQGMSSLQEEEELLAESAPETPTPTKKRRVSFADPIISGESPAHEATLCKIPDYFNRIAAEPGQTSGNSQSAASTENAGTTSSDVEAPADLSKQTGTEPSQNQAAQDVSNQPSQSSTGQASQSKSSQATTQGTPSQTSQNSYHSTQESQLDATSAVFPDLVNCDKPVDLILPQLTSSLWHRGLCQLMKARGVNTVGDLARLTEVEVQSMPVRAPKVDNVRTVLTSFHAQHYAKKTALSDSAPQCVGGNDSSRGPTAEDTIAS
ncbi:telomere-associated protein RIF1-like isoform X2 [Littorina saxatilis]|uniref:Telomere-associated protein Rif1 N-terminal domain-containing protein n=1 Tax=Littorina saxatilis TaxID=31220 RepID=A0AAN9GK67_9CAEN